MNRHESGKELIPRKFPDRFFEAHNPEKNFFASGEKDPLEILCSENFKN